MWMGDSQSRTSSGDGPVVILACLAVIALASSVLAQDGEDRLDYLDERLRIPESDRYTEGAYIESGVGLTFGVDRRLSYYPGNYQEAAGQFEEAVRRFRYKAEIWVFLSRAYFFMKAPEKAREALKRAAGLMPDLEDRLWAPLIRGLEWEIRARANAQQVQADFYTTDQGEFLSLFRLYRFLADTAGAAQVIHAADLRAIQMETRARMVSADSRRAYVGQAAFWQNLADSLRVELMGMGGFSPELPRRGEALTPASGTAGIEESERLRILQLKIDFYRADPDDFRELFDGYLAADRPKDAARMLEAIDREMKRLQIQASVAPNVQMEEEIAADTETLKEMQEEFRQILEPAPGP